jgi:hypothetical protein
MVTGPDPRSREQAVNGSQTTSGEHLTDEMLAAVAAGSARDGHLALCAQCQSRLTGWQSLAVAAGTVSAELTGRFATPGFDELLGSALARAAAPAEPVEAPVEVPPPGLARSWRLTVGLALAQLRLLPRALAPLTLLGFAGTVLVAVLASDRGMSTGLFGLGVTLVIQLGVLTACSTRTDPRLEQLATMMVAPPVVFAIRMVVVLALDTVLALAASAVAARLGVASSVPELVAGWFGQAMLASAVGAVCAVWRSTAVGAAAATAVWLLGALDTFSTGGVGHRLGALIAPLWSTGPLTLVVSAVLLAVAAVGMRQPRYRPHEL